MKLYHWQVCIGKKHSVIHIQLVVAKISGTHWGFSNACAVDKGVVIQLENLAIFIFFHLFFLFIFISWRLITLQ